MEPFKNLLNEKAALRISTAIKRSHPEFDTRKFLKGIKAELAPLELKERMLVLMNRLVSTLPPDPKKSFPILTKSLKLNDSDEIGLSGFLVWPLSQYVATQGLDSYDEAMRALYKMTQVFTSEFAVRPFLIHHEERTLKLLSEWAKDENEHVRRLVSEGTRPLLPWAERIPAFVKNPERTWSLLEMLKNDPAKYVQKSVANHINDHSKNHGDWVVKQLNKWKVNSESQPSVDWIIRHATRTLVKKGHPGALSLHGIRSVDFGNVRVRLLASTIKIGEALSLTFSLKNPGKKECKVVADCQILFLKANGKHSPKVFKGKNLVLKPNEKKTVQLRIPIKQVTTRKYYTGKHGCSILINGKPTPVRWFELCDR